MTLGPGSPVVTDGVRPDRGAVRLVRALAWTATAIGLSTGAHVIGGGALPAHGTMAVIGLLLLWSGLLLTRWRLGRATLTLSLGISQAIVHAVLTAAEAAPALPGCTPSGGHHPTLSCAAEASTQHHTGTAMLLAHAVAALLLALLLARGEDALWAIAGLLWPSLPTVHSPSARDRTAFVPVHEGEHRQAVPTLGGVGRRGPPVGLASSVT